MSDSSTDRRVLLVGNFLSTSFTRTVCEDLAERLANSGWAVLTTSKRVGRVARLFDMMDTTWTRRHQYAVAHVDIYSGAAFFWAEAVCAVLRRAGKPYVLTLHGGNLPSFARRRPHRVRRLLCSAAAVTTPSNYLFDHMLSYCAGLQLLSNPIDLRKYEFRLHTPFSGKLVWLRAFHEIYNPSLAPKVLALLAHDFPQVGLTMIGPDKGDGSLQHTRKVASQLRVAERIRILGGIPKSEIPEVISRGDVFINTTNIDNTPVSILEAMACGLPIVSTNVGGIPYLLENEQTALLVPPDDPANMAAAVRRLFLDYDLAEQLSRNARGKAVQFDWSSILQSWESLLLRIARRPVAQNTSRCEQ